jgi:2-dehydro-3-deoxy-D-gluconate 5-dehydrogenase
MDGIMKRFSLEGKTAIVTGSGVGLGQGMATALAQAGANIVGVDYRESSETKKRVEAAGRKYLEIKADLSSLKPIAGIMEQAVSMFGKVDILVNNAGIIRRTDAVDFSEKDWDDVINLNLKTLFFFCQAAGRQFLKQGGGGRIINVASMLSFQGGIRVPSYTASKSGVLGITRLLANEWAQHGITVNAVAPGYMATDNTSALRADPKRSADILARIPAGRWGTPEDLMGAAVFLASDAASYVNGSFISVDGGWLAR